VESIYSQYSDYATGWMIWGLNSSMGKRFISAAHPVFYSMDTRVISWG